MVLAGVGVTGYWLYGERLPSVLARAADGAATRARSAATSTRERLDAGALGDTTIDSTNDRAQRSAPSAATRAVTGDSLRWIALNSGDLASANGSANGSATGTAPTTRTSAARATAARAASVLAPLARRDGPAYVTLTAAQAAAVLSPILSQQLPASTAHLALAFTRDQLHLRGDVRLGDLAGSAAGGATGSTVADGALRRIIGATRDRRDTLLLVGTLEPVREGLAQFRVQEVRLRGVDVPARAIPTLVGAIRREATRRDTSRASARGGRTSGLVPTDTLAADALPVPLPASIADVRVANGRLTLYKAVRP